MQVKIKKVHQDAKIPSYQTSGASGFDLVALETISVFPGETVLVKTGLAFEIPQGFELQVRPRSGMSLKTPIRIANAPGSVDADYRGEVCVIVTNTAVHEKGSPVPVFKIQSGDRVAQGVIAPVVQVEFIEEELSQTERGAGAFGSTGAR